MTAGNSRSGFVSSLVALAARPTALNQILNGCCAPYYRVGAPDIVVRWGTHLPPVPYIGIFPPVQHQEAAFVSRHLVVRECNGADPYLVGARHTYRCGGSVQQLFGVTPTSTSRRSWRLTAQIVSIHPCPFLRTVHSHGSVFQSSIILRLGTLRVRKAPGTRHCRPRRLLKPVTKS